MLLPAGNAVTKLRAAVPADKPLPLAKLRLVSFARTALDEVFADHYNKRFTEVADVATLGSAIDFVRS